jgi:Spy/CpxP family protein refolding chaperone
VTPTKFTDPKTKERTQMRTILGVMTLLIVFLFVASSTSYSQPMRMSLEDRVKALKDTLSLSDEQAAKLTEIYKESDTERQKIREESQGDMTVMREAMTKLRESTNAKIDSILTPDQMKKFEEYNKARGARMQGRPGGPPGGGQQEIKKPD